MPTGTKIKLPAKAPAKCGQEIVPPFDYGSIDPAVAAEAQETADRIRAGFCDMRLSIIEIGNDLLKIKNMLAHGEFGAWLDAEFGMSDRTARRYMLAAETLGSISDNLAELPKHVINALAAPSTPDVVKDVVIAEVEAGNTPKVADVKSMIAEAKAIEAAAPDMPPAKKAAAVKTALATKKETVQEQAAKIVEKVEAKVAAKLKDQIKAEIAEEATLSPVEQIAHDKAAKQAVALLFQHLPGKTLAAFIKHYGTAGWTELAERLAQMLGSKEAA